MSACILLVTDRDYKDLTTMCIHAIDRWSGLGHLDKVIVPSHNKDVRGVTPKTWPLTQKYFEAISRKVTELDNLKHIYDTILVLDVDCMITGNISDLLTQQGDVFAVMDRTNTARPNGGLVRYSSEALRSFSVTSKYIEFLSTYTGYCPDEDFLEKFNLNKLPEKYNVQPIVDALWSQISPSKLSGGLVHHYMCFSKPDKVVNTTSTQPIVDTIDYAPFFKVFDSCRDLLSQGFVTDCEVFRSRFHTS